MLETKKFSDISLPLDMIIEEDEKYELDSDEEPDEIMTSSAITTRSSVSAEECSK